MKPSSRRRPARPERIRLSLFDDPQGSVPIPLPSRRMWPAGVAFAGLFAIFAGIAVVQIANMRVRVGTVFDLMSLLFQGFWILGWSVGVLILFLGAVLFLFYSESARIKDGRLIYVPRLGPLKVLVYDLTKIRNLRLENAGRGDVVRIRFDYGEGDTAIGGDMPRAVAEPRVGGIESAIAALGEQPGASGVRLPDAERVPPPAARTVPIPATPLLTAPSALALVGANLVPLAGILLLGWDLGEVMPLFWAENAVIGIYNLLKLAVIAKWGILFIGPFFVGHYGGFMAAHFLFIYYLFVRGIGATGSEAPVLAALGDLFVPLWPALLALVVSHGVSFVTNFLGQKEYVERKVSEQMSEPYKRIILLHVTIIFGGWMILLLGSPLPALILLIGLKTVVDLRAHRKEHRKAVI